MKGKKCIGLLIFFTTCLLSLNLFSNANAIEKIDTLQRGYVSSINFNTYNPNNTYTNQTILNNTYSPLYQVTLPLNGITRFSSLEIKLDKTFNVTSNHYYDITIYIYTRIEDGAGYVVTPMCPGFSNTNIRIDDCQVEYHDFINEQDRLESFNNDYNIVSRFNGYYAMTLKGHFTGTSSGNTTSFSGAFLSINNIAAPQDMYVLLGFSNYRVYTLKDAPEDEAAKKELEDRDNLESQSTSTDNQADNAGQSAENTGTTLFAAFTQFFNALTNVSGSSCVLPRMQVYSLDLGQMDLCTFDIPPQIMALVSIGMVFIIVPLGIHLVKRMINLYKEITG